MITDQYQASHIDLMILILFQGRTGLWYYGVFRITYLPWLQIQDLQNLLEQGALKPPRVMEVMTHHHLALLYKLVGLSKGMKILLKMCSFAPRGIWGMHPLRCISYIKTSLGLYFLYKPKCFFHWIYRLCHTWQNIV